jgi:DNA repair protein RadA/Sms
VEEVAAPAPRRRGIRPDAGSGIEPVRLGAISTPPIARLHTAIDELDFVLGGGIVPGSLTLIGGEPGIGKSTLLLQCAAQLQAAGVTTLYSSGEESVDQVRLRAERIREDASNVAVLPEVRVEAVIERAARYGAHVLIIDSIQMSWRAPRVTSGRFANALHASCDSPKSAVSRSCWWAT